MILTPVKEDRSRVAEDWEILSALGDLARPIVAKEFPSYQLVLDQRHLLTDEQRRRAYELRAVSVVAAFLHANAPRKISAIGYQELGDLLNRAVLALIGPRIHRELDNPDIDATGIAVYIDAGTVADALAGRAIAQWEMQRKQGVVSPDSPKILETLMLAYSQAKSSHSATPSLLSQAPALEGSKFLFYPHSIEAQRALAAIDDMATPLVAKAIPPYVGIPYGERAAQTLANWLNLLTQPRENMREEGTPGFYGELAWAIYKAIPQALGPSILATAQEKGVLEEHKAGLARAAVEEWVGRKQLGGSRAEQIIEQIMNAYEGCADGRPLIDAMAPAPSERPRSVVSPGGVLDIDYVELAATMESGRRGRPPGYPR